MDDYKPLTQQELDRGYFFLTHRPLFKKVIFALAALAVLVLYVFLIFGLIRLFQGEGMQQMAMELNQNADWASYHQLRAPQPLEVTGTQLISLGNRRYNLVAFIDNVNANWAVREAQYRFVVNGQPLDTAYTFFNPNEKHIVADFAYESPQSINNLTMEFGKLSWQRIDEGDSSVNWQINNVEYFPATRQTEGGRTFDVPARVTWQARNMSLYSFWEVKWQVILLNNDKLVGIQEITSQDFSSLETRDLEAVWLGTLPRVTSAQVFPLLNHLDNSNYKSLAADQGGL